MKRIGRTGVLLFVWVVAAGCGPSTPEESQWTRTELYLGLSRPDGKTVTDAEWTEFLDSAVTPRFPDGLTILQAQGRYRMSDQRIITETTRVLVILHDPLNESVNCRIEAICDEYARRFEQESVLRTDAPARASFVRPGMKMAAGEAAR